MARKLCNPTKPDEPRYAPEDGRMNDIKVEFTCPRCESTMQAVTRRHDCDECRKRLPRPHYHVRCLHCSKPGESYIYFYTVLQMPYTTDGGEHESE